MLIGGAALQVEDLSIVLKIVTFTDPVYVAMRKYKGRVSKRRYNNILMMKKRIQYIKTGVMLQEMVIKNREALNEDT